MSKQSTFNGNERTERYNVLMQLFSAYPNVEPTENSILVYLRAVEKVNLADLRKIIENIISGTNPCLSMPSVPVLIGRYNDMKDAQKKAAEPSRGLETNCKLCGDSGWIKFEDEGVPQVKKCKCGSNGMSKIIMGGGEPMPKEIAQQWKATLRKMDMQAPTQPLTIEEIKVSPKPSPGAALPKEWHNLPARKVG